MRLIIEAGGESELADIDPHGKIAGGVDQQLMRLLPPRRGRCSRRSGRSSRHGPLRNPLNAVDPQLAGEEAALARSPDADQFILVQSGRTFLRAHY